MGELVKGKKVIKIYNFCVRMDKYSQNIKVNAGEIFPPLSGSDFPKIFWQTFCFPQRIFQQN